MPSAPDIRKTSGKRRVFLVDDHPVLREGVAALINQQPDLVVCGEAESAAEAMRALAAEEADLVIVDISLKGSDGLELIRNLKALKPTLPALVLSAHDEKLYAERAVRAGAVGYVMKGDERGRLLEGIHQALAGHVYLSGAIMAKLLAVRGAGAEPVNCSGPETLLSDRELEVFRLVGQGLAAQEIARRLSMSPKTVQRHRDNIRQKLGLPDNNRLQFVAVRWAYDLERAGQ